MSVERCSICERKLNGQGNNPFPFNGKICCDKCNSEFVIPLRIFLKSRDDNTTGVKKHEKNKK